MKRKLTSAFFVALVISGLFTFLLSKKLHSSAPVVQRKLYVAVAVPLQAGEVLKAEKLKLVDWPATFPLAGAFLNPKDLIGRSVLYPLAVNAPILEQDLSIPGMGLTVKIPDGMRAVALSSDEVVGVAGFLFPGSHVDVLVTYRSNKSPEPGTATVLQDAEVLATGHQVEPSPDGKPDTVNVVTLLMKPNDAQRVVLASTQGTIHFVLRNSADRSQVADPPVKLSELIADTGVHPLAANRPKASSRPRPYVVETVTGDKQTATSFN